MTEATGLPLGSVVLVHEGVHFPHSYQRSTRDHWSDGAGVRKDSQMAEFIRTGHAEVIHRGPDPDEALAEFMWNLFEVPNGAESWALAGDPAQRNQVGYAKQVREFVKRQEEEGK